MSSLQAALPLPVSNPRRGIGSFITFDLGELSTGTNVHVWIYLCDWVVAKGGACVVSSNDLSKEGAPFDPLAGLMLEQITCEPGNGSIAFVFDHDIRMTLKPNLNAYAPNDDLVMFYRSGRKVLAIAPGCQIYEAS